MKKFKVVLSLTLLLVVLTTSVVGANTIARNVTASLDGGISVTFNGVKQALKNSAGSDVHPLVYNGTTYLPVRNVAELAGVEVSWDGQTRTVGIKQVESSSPKSATGDWSFAPGLKPSEGYLFDTPSAEVVEAFSKSEGNTYKVQYSATDDEGKVIKTTHYLRLPKSFTVDRFNTHVASTNLGAVQLYYHQFGNYADDDIKFEGHVLFGKSGNRISDHFGRGAGSLTFTRKVGSKSAHQNNVLSLEIYDAFGELVYSR